MPRRCWPLDAIAPAFLAGLLGPLPLPPLARACASAANGLSWPAAWSPCLHVNLGKCELVVLCPEEPQDLDDHFTQELLVDQQTGARRIAINGSFEILGAPQAQFILKGGSLYS